MNPDFRYVPLKCLPIPAVQDLADLLDTHGRLSVETFCDKLQNYCLLRGVDLKMSPPWITANRFRAQHSPTENAFRHLRSFRVSVGDVQYVLNEMGAATEDIFQKYKFEILQHHSNGKPREVACTCRNCRRGPDLNSDLPSYRRSERNSSNASHQNTMPNSMGQRYSTRPRTDHQSSTDRRSPRILNRLSAQPEQRANIQIASAHVDSHNEWEPPTCYCSENDCEICEQQRLLDPDETALLSPSSNASRGVNVLSQRLPLLSLNVRGEAPHHGQSGHEEDVQINNISYSENLPESRSLRGAAEGNSMRSDNSKWNKHSSSHGKKMEMQSQHPLECTCKKLRIRTKDGENCCAETIFKRNSAPSESSSFLEQGSRSSSSDPNLNTWTSQSYSRQQSSDDVKKILISYTDDTKEDMIELASNLKRQGHTVNTDLQVKTFLRAKNHGLVSEEDQYTWLRKKYINADFVIVCSSKGYGECLNSRQVVPSTAHLNARYIYELISDDRSRSRKIIEVSFRTDNFCLNFQVKRFVLPQENYTLYDYIYYNY